MMPRQGPARTGRRPTAGGRNDQRLVELEREIAALRDTERRYRLLIDRLPDAVYIHQDRKIVFVNQAAVSMLGASGPDDLIGRSTFELIHPEFRDLVRARYDRMVEDGAAVPLLRQKRIRLDGTVVDVETAAIPHVWEGRPAVMAVNRDISERLRMEGALRASEELRARLVELLPDAIYIHQDGRIVYANSAAVRQAGAASLDELLGRHHLDFIAEDFHDTVTALSDRVVSEGTASAFNEVRRRRVDGTEYLSESAGIPVEWQGAPATLVVVRDVTESRMRQIELAEKSVVLATTLESIDQGLWVFDAEGRLRAWNRRLMEAMHYPPALARVGTSFEEFIRFSAQRGDYGPGDTEDLVKQRKGVIRRGETYTKERTGPDGRIYEVRHNPMPDGGFVATFTDITERKRSAEALTDLNSRLEEQARELQRSNEDLQQFAYVASHDLQEPLRIVSGYCQLLQKRYDDALDDDAREFIAFAVDAAARMQKLINDLLQYSRIGTRGRPFENIPARELVDAALANLMLALDESRAVVEVGDLPVVCGDRTQLVQLFQNLIGNAIKFCKDRTPEVRITAEKAGDGWSFTVRDNGIGIDPAYQDRIFLIFQRLHGRDEYPGTGIGLALCKKIVARHGGQMRVDSKVGQGSAFIFTLPGPREGEGA